VKQHIALKFNALPENRWTEGDIRSQELAHLDAILEGEFYEALSYSFYQETTSGDAAGGTYIPVRDRRPSFQFNLFGMLASQIARKLFGGDHAPRLVHSDKTVKKGLDALKKECSFNSLMLEAIEWGSVGSVCTYFQLVPFTTATGAQKTKLIAKNVRSRFCTPTFNKLDELQRLLIHYPTNGSDFLYAETPITVDSDGEPIEGRKSYWHIMEFTTDKEIHYKPIKIEKWRPVDGKNGRLEMETEVQHGLGFVPAHWFRYRTGNNRSYDGKCYWKDAINNIIDLDYTISSIGSGIRYNSVPQVVIKGPLLNSSTTDGSLGRGASRFIQISADQKIGDEEQKNSDVHMLEAKGDGMKVGLEYWAPLVLRMALQQIAASVKDPNKITTAPSGKSLEVLDSEYLDLSRDLRTVFGDDGALKLFQKMAAACVCKHHVLVEGISLADIDTAEWAWPPLTSIGMAEFQCLANALSQLLESKIFSVDEAKNYTISQIDMPEESVGRDYLQSVDSQQEDQEPPVQEENSNDGKDAFLAEVAASALRKAQESPLNTKFPFPA
jgi:hypothetical protein